MPKDLYRMNALMNIERVLCFENGWWLKVWRPQYMMVLIYEKRIENSLFFYYYRYDR